MIGPPPSSYIGTSQMICFNIKSCPIQTEQCIVQPVNAMIANSVC